MPKAVLGSRGRVIILRLRGDLGAAMHVSSGRGVTNKGGGGFFFFWLGSMGGGPARASNIDETFFVLSTIFLDF